MHARYRSWQKKFGSLTGTGAIEPSPGKSRYHTTAGPFCHLSEALLTKYRKAVMKRILRLFFSGILFCTFISNAAPIPLPVAPDNGAVISTNSPTLVWAPTDADSFFVEVDGHVLDRVSGDRDRASLFPLSFGMHGWRIIAVRRDTMIPGPVWQFYVQDRPAGSVPPGALHLRDGWKMCSAVTAGMDGSRLSSAGADTCHWRSTSVPVTVLSALVRNGVYPNPYTGINNLRIPDIHDGFNEANDLMRFSHIPGRNPWKQPYWFRTDFRLPAEFRNRTLILQFNEINYKAALWINGVQIADTSRMKGMERRFRFDVTPYVKDRGQNHLAVSVYPPDHPGEPSPPPRTFTDHPGRNLGADGRISLDYTKWDALGWDWQPAVRDRDTGITDEVFLMATGPVEIRDPYMSAQVPLPDTSFVYLRTALTLINHSDRVQKGSLEIRIHAIGYNDPPVSFVWPAVLQPCDTLTLCLTPHDVPALKLEHPRLWWPLDWGKPDRYRFSMRFMIHNEMSHQVSDIFGIRDIQTRMGMNERVFSINGHDVYMKGGNWVIDMMLNWTASRYVDEMALSALCHMNMQRIWGPTGVPPDILFHAADSLGILVWQDFLNDFWGTFRNDPRMKPPAGLFYDCTVDVVKRLRNHPSLVMWCGGNEGPNQYESMIMHHILPEYDAWGGRPYLRISNGDGLHGGGPYHTIRPEAYFHHEKVTGFSSEIGPSGVPVAESLFKFLPETGKTWVPGKFPLYNDWGYHDATERGQGDPRRFSFYDAIVREDYGVAFEMNRKGVADYAERAQLVNYDVYRAAVEAVNRGLWDASSGFALWKFNASWPGLTWQLFDWYLTAHAGFYAVQRACEPVHVQWNRDSNTLSVINSGLTKPDSLYLTAEIWSGGEIIWNRCETMTAAPDRAIQTRWRLPAAKGLEFVRLQLRRPEGTVVSRNLYWRHPGNDFTGLFSMPRTVIAVRADTKMKDGQKCMDIHMNNPGGVTAFFIRFSVAGAKSREAVVPLFCSDNYISLVPGEKRAVRITCDVRDMMENGVLIWEGVNVAPGELSLD